MQNEIQVVVVIVVHLFAPRGAKGIVFRTLHYLLSLQIFIQCCAHTLFTYFRLFFQLRIFNSLHHIPSFHIQFLYLFSRYCLVDLIFLFLLYCSLKLSCDMCLYYSQFHFLFISIISTGSSPIRCHSFRLKLPQTNRYLEFFLNIC